MPVFKEYAYAEFPSLLCMSAIQIAWGGKDLFPRFPRRDDVHTLIDEAYAQSLAKGRSKHFAEEPFPICIAEEVRKTILEGSGQMGNEYGPIVAEAARSGYWLDGPHIWNRCSRFDLTWFQIWYIDSSHELCGCKPAVSTGTLREAYDWILAAPVHEFEGYLETAHERLQYKSARQRCLTSGAAWSWPPLADSRPHSTALDGESAV